MPRFRNWHLRLSGSLGWKLNPSQNHIEELPPLLGTELVCKLGLEILITASSVTILRLGIAVID